MIDFGMKQALSDDEMAHNRFVIVDFNGFAFIGLTPLHIAIKAEDIRSVELLCSRSDVNCYETKQGRSPLQLAIMTNNLSIVNQLLQNVNTSPEHDYSRSIACYSWRFSCSI